jgi:5-methyltetrahydrofolate--homocysteine methyltransferase
MFLEKWMIDYTGIRPLPQPKPKKPIATQSELLLMSAFQKRGYRMDSNVKLHGYYPDLRICGTNILIEVDGNIHKLPEVKARDKERAKNLRSHGYKILRCTNAQVAKDPYKIVDKAIEMLAKELNKRRYGK